VGAVGALDNLFGGGTSSAEKFANNLITSDFTDEALQRFLPPSLKFGNTGDILQSGIQGIGELIQNPGGLGGNVADAIRQRLATESEGISRDFRGIKENQAGAAARSNLPTSIKTALSSALDVAQNRAQRGARREALTDSESLRREDLDRTFSILDALLQFTSTGRSQAVGAATATAGLAENRKASELAFFGNLLSSAGSQ